MRFNVTTNAIGSIIEIVMQGFNTPNVSLTQWPASGGFTLNVYSSTGSILATATGIKLTGVFPATLLAASITNDPLKQNVVD